MMPGTRHRALERRSFFATERRHPGIGPGVLPGAVVGGEDNDGVGRFGSDHVHHAANVGVEFEHRVRVVAQVRLALESLRDTGRVVQLHEIDAHEERAAAFRVLLDIGNRRIGLPHVKLGQVVVRDSRDFGGGLSGHAFPFVQVDDLLVLLPELRVVLRKPRVKGRRRIVVGVDARVIGCELLHFVVPVLDRIELGLVAEVPLAGEVSRVSVLLEELGDRRRLLPEPVLVTGGDDDRQRRADRNVYATSSVNRGNPAQVYFKRTTAIVLQMIR